MSGVKKTIRNVWVVQDKLPNCSEQLFFAGLAKSNIGTNVSRFEPLSSETKTYSSKRKADAASRIANKYYESPFITSVFIESAEVDIIHTNPKTTTNKSTELSPLDLVPESEFSGWVTLERLCGKYPLMLRKKFGDVFRFAIAYSDKELRYLPADEVFAWNRYFDECKEFVTNKIRARRISEGKDPDGADEWKKGAGT